MSTIHSTRSTATTKTTTHSKTRATTPVAATRANTEPPQLDIRSLNGDLNLTEAQRAKLRPILTADGRKQGQASHMHWSSDAARRSTLWEARDQTVKQIQQALDPKQIDLLKPFLGPSK